MDKSTPFPWEFDGETIAFETPEQTRVEYRIAPFGTRILAAANDQILISLIGVATLVLGILTFSFFGFRYEYSRDSLGYVIAMLNVNWFIVSLFYFVWGEIRREGQTWGKRRLNIRTCMITGHGVTMGAALLRNLARVVDVIPLFWIVPMLSQGKRRIGDFIAGTIVVVSEQPERQAAAKVLGLFTLAPSYRELDPKQFYFSSEVSQRLVEDDLNLLEHLDARLESALPSKRRLTIADVANKYSLRLEMSDQASDIEQSPQRFLQELGLFLRDRYERDTY